MYIHLLTLKKLTLFSIRSQLWRTQRESNSLTVAYLLNQLTITALVASFETNDSLDLTQAVSIGQLTGVVLTIHLQ